MSKISALVGHSHWAVVCAGAGVVVVKPDAAVFLPCAILRSCVVMMPQRSQMVLDSMVGVSWVSALPHIPLRITAEQRPWLEGGMQWPLFLLMSLIRRILPVTQMCREPVINVTERSFQCLQFTRTSVPSHSQKPLVTVKLSRLELMVRFFSFPILCAGHAGMAYRGSTKE